MNLKYYLRGLGIGIVVSTLIVGIAARNRSGALSDEEIRQRAKELGMVEASGVLTDDVQEPIEEEAVKTTPAPKAEEEEPALTAKAEEEKTASAPKAEEEEPAPTPKAEEKPEATATPEVEEEVKATATPEAEEKVKATPVPKTEEEEKPTSSPKAEKQEAAESEPTPKTDETVTIVVNSGSGSYNICKQLEEAGLVKSAAEYDTYLYERGYDKRIVAATHEIPLDADQEQIAQILIGK